MGHRLIVVIVDINKNEAVMAAARRGGATGGTILRGKGTSIFEHQQFLGIEIEPEKDVILVITDETRTEDALKSITTELGLNEPYRGIAFVLNLQEVIGLREND
jgi:nitrogen regulatory protein PII